MAGDSPGNGKARGVEEGGEAVVDQTSLDDKSLYELFVAPKGSETNQDEEMEDGADGAAAQGVSAPRHAYQYDAAAGQFNVAEHRKPTPIVHAPLPTYKQQTLREVVGDGKRGREPHVNRHLARQLTRADTPTPGKAREKLSAEDEACILQHEGTTRQRTPGYVPLDFDEKKYLVLQYRRSHGVGNELPDNAQIRQYLKDDQTSKVLSRCHDLQHVRNFFRFFSQCSIKQSEEQPQIGSASAGCAKDAN
jgi:hypothetical protein